MTSERTKDLCGYSCGKVAFARSLFEAVRRYSALWWPFWKALKWLRSVRMSPDGTQILSAAASTGHIAFWDLNSGGKLLHVIRGAHEGAATAIEWIPGQPILVSSGEDNSVKVG